MFEYWGRPNGRVNISSFRHGKKARVEYMLANDAIADGRCVTSKVVWPEGHPGVDRPRPRFERTFVLDVNLCPALYFTVEGYFMHCLTDPHLIGVGFDRPVHSAVRSR
jgi:hypothetical protein